MYFSTNFRSLLRGGGLLIALLTLTSSFAQLPPVIEITDDAELLRMSQELGVTVKELADIHIDPCEYPVDVYVQTVKFGKTKVAQITASQPIARLEIKASRTASPQPLSLTPGRPVLVSLNPGEKYEVKSPDRCGHMITHAIVGEEEEEEGGPVDLPPSTYNRIIEWQKTARESNTSLYQFLEFEDFKDARRVSIFDSFGRRLYSDESFESGGPKIQISIGNLVPGVYFLTVEDALGKVATKKFTSF